jgi:S-adenosylmethionine synthetase
MARYIAKNIVAADLAKRCEVQIAYAIGMAEPVSVLVESFGTGVIPDERLSQVVRENFDLRPAAIIQSLNLKRPIYRPTAAYGHFGRPAEGELFTWERLDKVDALKRSASTK